MVVSAASRPRSTYAHVGTRLSRSKTGGDGGESGGVDATCILGCTGEGCGTIGGGGTRGGFGEGRGATGEGRGATGEGITGENGGGLASSKVVISQ